MGVCGFPSLDPHSHSHSHLTHTSQSYQVTTMVQITGTYTQTSRENYEEFLKALDVGFILRKAALASTPVMSIEEKDGNWVMITKTTVKSIELKFRLGEEFEEDTTDGRHCKTTVTLDGNVMTTKQKATKSGEKDVTVVRTFSDDGISLTMSTDGATSVQKYKRD